MSDKKAYLNIPGEKSRELLARRQQFVARGVSSTMSVFAAKAEGLSSRMSMAIAISTLPVVLG